MLQSDSSHLVTSNILRFHRYFQRRRWVAVISSDLDCYRPAGLFPGTHVLSLYSPHGRSPEPSRDILQLDANWVHLRTRASAASIPNKLRFLLPQVYFSKTAHEGVDGVNSQAIFIRIEANRKINSWQNHYCQKRHSPVLLELLERYRNRATQDTRSNLGPSFKGCWQSPSRSKEGFIDPEHHQIIWVEGCTTQISN